MTARTTYRAAAYVAVVLASCLACLSAANDDVDALFKQWDGEQSPGCAVAALHRGKVVHDRGYGLANLEQRTPINGDTVFLAASVAKQFTAAAVALLVHDEVLSLDDEVRDYVSDLPRYAHQVTIRQLIHHMGGLPDERKLLHHNGWRFTLDRIFQSDSLYVLGLQNQLLFEPGSRFQYSNTGYVLLAEIVERVSGNSFREFTSKRLFEPLGMSHTFFRDDFLEVVPNRADGYRRGRKEGSYRRFVTNYDTVGSTGLLTTTRDLLRWQRNFDDPRVGGDGLIEALLARGQLQNGESVDYAFGLNHTTYRGHDVIGHAGADAGYRAYLARFPAEQFSVAILCNVIIDPAAKSYQVADVLIGDKLDQLPEADSATEGATFPIDAADLKAKEGRFWAAARMTFRRLHVRDGRLLYEYAGTPWEMFPLSPSRFRFAWGAEVEFSNDNQAFTEFRGTPDENSYVRLEPHAPTARELEEFTGRFETDQLIVPYLIKLDGDALSVIWMKHERRLTPLKPDVFTSPGLGIVTFVRATNGSVDGLRIESSGISLTMQRASN